MSLNWRPNLKIACKMWDKTQIKLQINKAWQILACMIKFHLDLRSSWTGFVQSSNLPGFINLSFNFTIISDEIMTLMHTRTSNIYTCTCRSIWVQFAVRKDKIEQMSDTRSHHQDDEVYSPTPAIPGSFFSNWHKWVDILGKN